MKKLVMGILVVLVVGVGAVLAMALGQPDNVHVQRSITVAATPADLSPFAEDLVQVTAWSPWQDKDPDLVKTWSDTTTGVGAWYAWEGNEDVGRGKQTTMVIEPGRVVHHLEFFEPFAGEANSTITYSAAGDGSSVTWSFDQEADFGTKLMTVFVDMDDMLGPDFDEGLSRLKPLVQAAATARMQAEAAATKAAAEAAEPDPDAPQ